MMLNPRIGEVINPLALKRRKEARTAIELFFKAKMASLEVKKYLPSAKSSRIQKSSLIFDLAYTKQK